MPNCAIINCKNSSKRVGRVNGDISFHSFPSDPTIKEKWIDATGNKDWFPSKYSKICSIHFTEDDFVVNKKNRRLNGTAYPKILVLSSITNGEKTEHSHTTTDSGNANGDQVVNTKESRLYKKIRQQHLKIKRLREQNRRKCKKIENLESIIDFLRTEFEHLENKTWEPGN